MSTDIFPFLHLVSAFQINSIHCCPNLLALHTAVRKSTSATERVTSSQAPVTESVDPCGWDRVGKNGDGILVAATIFLFITAILLSIIALALMKSTSSSKTYDVSETARSNALRNATSVSSVAKASDAVSCSPKKHYVMHVHVLTCN